MRKKHQYCDGQRDAADGEPIEIMDRLGEGMA